LSLMRPPSLFEFETRTTEYVRDLEKLQAFGQA